MSQYGSYVDEYYVNMHLHTEMELPQQREPVLHFFELIQRHFPKMRNFYMRERGEFVLEEDKDQGTCRWVSVEPRRVSSGVLNPQSLEEAMHLHRQVLETVPYALSVSHLDCESLNVMFGFDYNYRGNHSALVAETLGLPAALEPLATATGTKLLGYEPMIQLALDESCRTQARLSFECRTLPEQVRSTDFSEELLSVYLTVRRYDSLEPGEDFPQELARLAKLAQDLVDQYVVGQVLRPLQQAISLK